MPKLHITDQRLQTFYDYWEKKRGTRIAPKRSEMSPEELGPKILPYMCIIEINTGPPRRFRYRLIGTAIVREYGGDPTGKYVDEVDLDTEGYRIIAEMGAVANTGIPAASVWNFVKKDGRKIHYEHVLLPLSDDGKTVNQLLCAAIMKGVA